MLLQSCYKITVVILENKKKDCYFVGYITYKIKRPRIFVKEEKKSVVQVAELVHFLVVLILCRDICSDEYASFLSAV